MVPWEPRGTRVPLRCLSYLVMPPELTSPHPRSYHGAQACITRPQLPSPRTSPHVPPGFKRQVGDLVELSLYNGNHGETG